MGKSAEYSHLGDSPEGENLRSRDRSSKRLSRRKCCTPLDKITIAAQMSFDPAGCCCGVVSTSVQHPLRLRASSAAVARRGLTSYPHHALSSSTISYDLRPFIQYVLPHDFACTGYRFIRGLVFHHLPFSLYPFADNFQERPAYPDVESESHPKIL